MKSEEDLNNAQMVCNEQMKQPSPTGTVMMKFKKVVQLDVLGIKCDHCDYKDMSVKYREYEKYVNSKCPECGESLLTAADYKTTKVMVAMCNVINFVCYPISIFGRNKTVEYASAEMNGSGKVEIKTKI